MTGAPISDQAQADPLEPLLTDLFEGGLDAQRMRLLEQVLRDDPAARSRYRRYVRLHATLEWELLHPHQQDLDSTRHVAQRSGSANPAPATRQAQARAGRPWIRILVVMSLLIAAALGILVYDRAPDAVVIAIDGVRLQGGDPPLAGQPLPPRMWSLEEGVLRLRLHRGAVVAIRGPAVFTVTDGNAVSLSSGIALAVVPPEALGFRVATPHAQVIDLGTEFAVQVEGGSGTTVHVRRGQVEVGGATATTRQGVSAGEARAIDATGAIAIASFDAELFTDGHSIAGGQPTLRRLRSDPALIALFGDGHETAHADQWRSLAAKPSVSPASIARPAWVPGRFPGTRALAFTSSEDRISLDVPGNFTALTLMTWIQIHARTAEPIALCATDGWGAPPILHWLCEVDGKLRLHLYSPSGRIWNWMSERAIPAPSIGWHHLAVTCDESGLVRFYCDGDLLGEQQHRHTVGFSIGPMEIGNWRAFARPGSQRASGRNLVGDMDEFGLLARDLTSAEIRSLAREGRP